MTKRDSLRRVELIFILSHSSEVTYF